MGPMADLIDLNYLKTALGAPLTNSPKDARYLQAIAEASTAIRSYTERDFNTTTVTEARTFDYDGSGYLDTDDASVITGVTLLGQAGVNDYPLDSLQWRAMPPRRADAPVFYYLLLPGFDAHYAPSPEMGFTRNLDVFAAEGRYHGFNAQFEVSGTWGWPAIPDDVKRATVWTAMTMHENPSAYVSESIEGYSRSIGFAPADSIPDRAKDLLAPYLKLKV